MPTYEYICTECKEKIEIQASIAEKEKGLKVVCPKCGSKKTKQIFTTFMMVCGSDSKGTGCSTCGGGAGCCGG